MIRIRNDRTADTNASTHGSEEGDTTMSAPIEQVGFGRRQLLRYAGGAAVVAVAAGSGIKLLHPFSSSAVSAENHMASIQPDRYMFLGGTDGWIHLPQTPAIPPFHPDPWRRPRSRRTSSGSATSPD